MSNQRILYIFTRTPLHVGAGSSVGAIDQPVVRERHTGFPVIPASSLKGTFADLWNDDLLVEESEPGKTKKVRVNSAGERSDAGWLFGSDSDKHAAAGALQFSEAKLLAFPIRSARGSFAWITCPLMLQRAVRDGVLESALLDKLNEPEDGKAIFDAGNESKLAIGSEIVLEEYTFGNSPWLGVTQLGEAVRSLFDGDPLWKEVESRLVVLSNGMMSYFAQNACEVAQHVRINDETGTAEGGALFNQENVPSETLFYSILHAFDERSADKDNNKGRKGGEAFDAFGNKVNGGVFQFGGDASTGLGYCGISVSMKKVEKGENA